MGRLKGIKVISEGLKKVLKVVLTKSFNTFWPPQILKMKLIFRIPLQGQKGSNVFIIKITFSSYNLESPNFTKIFESDLNVVFSYRKCLFCPRATARKVQIIGI